MSEEKKGILNYIVSFFSPSSWKQWLNTKPFTRLASWITGADKQTNPENSVSKQGNVEELPHAFQATSVHTQSKTKLESDKNPTRPESVRSPSSTGRTSPSSHLKGKVEEVGNELEKRGEKLENVSHKSRAMLGAAGDLLQSVKQLKEQKQKENTWVGAFTSMMPNLGLGKKKGNQRSGSNEGQIR